MELKFGNAEAMMKMTQMIADREGLGDILAEGVKLAAEKIAKGSAKYAMEIKGQELPMHEPRGKVGLGIGYATSPTGADHVHNIHDVMFEADGTDPMGWVNEMGVLDPLSRLDLGPAKVRLTRYFINWRHFQNCATICIFPPFTPGQTVDLVNACTGWNTSLLELMKVGERSLALARAFNAREGYTAKDDILPDRFYQTFTSGPLKDNPTITRENMKQALQTYYAMSGWDAELGMPTKAQLQDLDIEWVVEELNKANVKV